MKKVGKPNTNTKKPLRKKKEAKKGEKRIDGHPLREPDRGGGQKGQRLSKSRTGSGQAGEEEGQQADTRPIEQGGGTAGGRKKKRKNATIPVPRREDDITNIDNPPHPPKVRAEELRTLALKQGVRTSP